MVTDIEKSGGKASFAMAEITDPEQCRDLPWKGPLKNIGKIVVWSTMPEINDGYWDSKMAIMKIF